MIPAVIVTAVKNTGYPVPEGAVEKAIERGSKVPGGWCGFYGACGVAIGAGTAVSVLTGATPLTRRNAGSCQRGYSLYALNHMIEGGARCCKRAGRKALQAAVEFLKTRMGIALKPAPEISCQYSGRNRECIHQDCVYYNSSLS